MTGGPNPPEPLVKEDLHPIVLTVVTAISGEPSILNREGDVLARRRRSVRMAAAKPPIPLPFKTRNSLVLLQIARSRLPSRLKSADRMAVDPRSAAMNDS
jgi:hypothetical protein